MTVTMPSAGSTSMSAPTLVSGSWWASGISSSVRLAAWMAAIRATAATSPLGASPAATLAAADGDIRTTARARAYRSVGAFALTSTMRARPAESKCVSGAPSIPVHGNDVGLQKCDTDADGSAVTPLHGTSQAVEAALASIGPLSRRLAEEVSLTALMLVDRDL